jgi:hypothetical protein
MNTEEQQWLLSLDFEPMIKQLHQLRYAPTPIIYVDIDHSKDIVENGNIYASDYNIINELYANTTWHMVKYKLLFPVDVDIDFTEEFYKFVDCPYDLFPIISLEQQEILSVHLYNYHMARSAKRAHFDENYILISLDHAIPFTKITTDNLILAKIKNKIDSYKSF